MGDDHASDSLAESSRSPDPDLRSLIDETVVLDLSSRYVILGTLRSVSEAFLVLGDADAHDLRDTSTTRDSYVLDACRHGVSIGRREVWVRVDEIVALSRLEDVIS